MGNFARHGPWMVLLVLALHGIPTVDGRRQPVPTPRGGNTPKEQPRTNLPATYWVTFSTQMLPGAPLPVTVRLVKPDVTSTVSVSLRNGSDESIVFAENASVTVSSNAGSKVINLEIPKHLKNHYGRGRFEYILRVTAEGDVSFNESKVVSLRSKFFSVFMQTDKAKYKPGHTVKFRILTMNPDLTVRHEPMDILVRDPNGNTMKMWRQATGYMNTGVVERKIPTSSEAPTGDWNIDVTVLNHTETKTFTIEKYVLPKFEAILDVPEVVLLENPSVKGKATAKYTFGKPLTKAVVSLCIKMSYFHEKDREQPVITKSGKVNGEGEFDFVVTRTEFLSILKRNSQYNMKRNLTVKDLNHQVFDISLNVTNQQSNKTMETKGQIKFTDQKAETKFLSISPTTFKPGLKFTALVKVNKHDGSLFENYKDINVTFNTTIKWKTLINDTTTPATATRSPLSLANGTMDEEEPKKTDEKKKPPLRPHYPRYEYHQEVLMVVNKTLTANGYLSVEVDDVPDKADSLEIRADVLNVNMYHNAQRATSPSDNFIQIQAQVDSPKAGGEASLLVKTTESVEKVIYQVYAKGILMEESEATAVDEDGRNFTVSFNVTANMAPTCRVLAFYFRDDGEIVVDSLSMKIDTSADVGVNVSYSKQKVKPGQNVDFVITSRPNSTVFLLSVDKSVKLLKSGNDIAQDMVDQELMQYGYGSGFHDFWRIMLICWWPFPTRKTDASGVFKEANVAVLTDGFLYENPENNGHLMYHTKGAPEGVVFDRQQPASKSGQADEKDVDRVRKFFPETWLFDAVFVGSDGKLLMPKTAPDTITTWLTTAFAVHPQHGLSVIPQPAELTTFRKMFLSLDMPYSAVRGEKLCMKAFAYNYHDKPLYMRLTFQSNEGIENIRIKRLNARPTQYNAVGKLTHRIGKVYPNHVRSTTFCFTPIHLGRIPLRVNLTANGMTGDGVERMLLVEAEGERRVQTTPVILDLKNQTQFKEDVDIKFPETTVKGSQKVTVAVAADLLGPVFDNIEDLLRMPYGCGEQNMLYFAPNVFLIDYLQKTDTYTADVAEKAENYMMTGYQKELKYKHGDGSYSAFGERPNRTDSGSMWLTAFVTKCFVQAMALEGDVIKMDKELVKKSIVWMLDLQAKNGSFPEPGKVFNKNMQGGSARGEALTAYVLVSLAEANKTGFSVMNEKEQQKLGYAISKGLVYLEDQLTSLTDPYDLCVVTYVLHLAHSRKADKAFELLKKKAISESLTMHWERTAKKEKRHYYWQRRADAINIEMTAYALLTYNLRNDLAGSMPIVRWLTQQRGPQGGFISTQDTVISLQALAQIAVDIYQPTFTPVNVSVYWSTMIKQNQHRTVTLDDHNKLLLHKIELPTEEGHAPYDVVVTAKTLDTENFTGVAVAEVIQDYNVQDEPKEDDVYMLEVDVKGLKTQMPVLKMTASRVDGQTGGMTVIEVITPTGFLVDTEHKEYDVTATMMTQSEEDGRKFILYYAELDDDPVKASLPLKASEGVIVEAEERIVTIYEYYESSSQRQSVGYDIDGLPEPDYTICDDMPDYESCGFF